jgi:hypothetical protein
MPLAQMGPTHLLAEPILRSQAMAVAAGAHSVPPPLVVMVVVEAN